MSAVLDALGVSETLFRTLLVSYLFGLSLQVVLRAGVFSLASAGFWGIGAYTVAVLTSEEDLP